MEKLARSRRKIPKLKPIARRRHNYIYLFLAILFGIATMYLIYNFPPSFKFHLSKYNIPIQLPVIPFFLISLAGFIYTTLTFIFIQRTQGIIVSLFIISYLIIRLLGLTHWVFGGLFIALFITAELFIFKKK